MVTGTEPSRGDAPRIDDAAALLERLAAVEAGIRDDCHRQPAAVLEEIARLWTAGATVSGVATGARVSPHIVRDRLRRAGALDYVWRKQHRHVQEVLGRRGAELVAAYEAGETLPALSARAGICLSTLRDYLVSRGVTIRNPIQRARQVLEAHGPELVPAYEAGASLRDLAARTGVSETAIARFLADRGVALRHDRGWYRRRSGHRTGRAGQR